MIAKERVPEMVDIMERCASSLPSKLRLFHQGCTNSGFTAMEALQLTLQLMRSVIAVPNPKELPDPLENGRSL